MAKTRTFEFEVVLAVADGTQGGAVPPKGSNASELLFAICRANTEAATKVAREDLLEAGVDQKIVNRLKMTAVFEEFDSPNPHHAGGMFNIRLSGEEADVDEAEQKWTTWMDGKGEARMQEQRPKIEQPHGNQPISEEEEVRRLGIVAKWLETVPEEELILLYYKDAQNIRYAMAEGIYEQAKGDTNFLNELYEKAEEEAYERAKQADADSASSEELEAAADKLAEVQAQAKAEDLLSTEEREEHDKAILEDIADRQGIDGVASMLRDICHLKAEHLRSNQQDETSAAIWEQCAEELDSFIGWYYGLGD